MGAISLRALVVMAVAFIASGGVSAQVLLQADFDDKTVDAPIGTGGAVAGEPVRVWNVTAIVRDAPLSSLSLELHDDDDYGTGEADFNFLANAEISSGFVSVVADIWLTSTENYYLGVRESGSAAYFFLDVEFREDGEARVWDSTGIVKIDLSYPTGRVIPIEIIFNMDAGTYDLHYDWSLPSKIVPTERSAVAASAACSSARSTTRTTTARSTWTTSRSWPICSGTGSRQVI